MDLATAEIVTKRVASAPMFTWISTLVGLALGAFMVGLLGARVVQDRVVRVTSAIGLVLSLWALHTFYIVYPEVLWVPCSMLNSVLVFPYLGGRVLVRYQSRANLRESDT